MNAIMIGEFIKIRAALGDEICKMRGASVLITGATGLIGSYLTEFLIYMNKNYALGMKIFASSSSWGKLVARFGVMYSDMQFIQADLSRQFAFPRRYDYVIHAASPAHPAAYINNPVGVMRVNMLGTMAVLDTAIERNGRMVFISSGEVYGVGNGPWKENSMCSADLQSVRSCYGESKRSAEVLCISHAAQYGTHVNIVRPCHVYGPTITNENSRADAQFLRWAACGMDIQLHSNGRQRRSWCYVADAVGGILRVLLCGKAGNAYNIANSASVATILEFAQTMANIAGVSVVYSDTDTSKADCILDATKLMQIGWLPEYGLSTGLRHTLDIYGK